jgi:hypothetical protein
MILLLPVDGTILGHYQEPRYLANWLAWFYQKKIGIGTAKRNWKQVKKIKHGDRANLGDKVTAKITNVYEQYQQVKSSNRDYQISSVGRLWTEEDLHCMKMDVFCSDIAKSLDTDARIRTLRTFRNWNESWQQPFKGVGPRGDVVLEERLKIFFWNQADIQQEAVLDTFSIVPEEKGKESILPYCYQ